MLLCEIRGDGSQVVIGEDHEQTGIDRDQEVSLSANVVGLWRENHCCRWCAIATHFLRNGHSMGNLFFDVIWLLICLNPFIFNRLNLLEIFRVFCHFSFRRMVQFCNFCIKEVIYRIWTASSKSCQHYRTEQMCVYAMEFS